MLAPVHNYDYHNHLAPNIMLRANHSTSKTLMPSHFAPSASGLTFCWEKGYIFEK